MKINILLISTMLLISCAHPGGWIGQNRGDGSIHETKIDEVLMNEKCDFLGIVKGDAKIWQVFVPFFAAKQTAKTTRDGAILKAQEMGGTHIVWREKGQFELFMAIAEGHVYRCR